MLETFLASQGNKKGFASQFSYNFVQLRHSKLEKPSNRQILKHILPGVTITSSMLNFFQNDEMMFPSM